MQRFRWAACIAALLLAGCGGPNGPAPIPQPGAPQITCGGAVTVDNVTTTSQPVSFSMPTTTQGSQPVAVACTPASGTTFPLGTTPVSCTATDAIGRQASCSFTVTLKHQEVALTKYMSFGDSLTQGVNGRPGFGFDNLLLDTPNAYPTFLQQMFVERIPSQSVSVLNAGKAGELAGNNDSRLKEELGRHQPQVLLLLEGINDLNAGSTSQTVVNALRDNIRTAKERGAQFVFVSTLLPVAPEVCGPPAPTCRALFTPGGNTTIANVNQSIRSMVAANGAHLVDPYDLFLANKAAYIDVDGLHMRPAGYQALAEQFWMRVVQVVPPKQLYGF